MSLYWIRLPEHTDMESEGYIGITNNINRRFKEHRDMGRKTTHLQNSIRKYKSENLIWEVIYTGCENYISELEYAYRPKPNIGWNSAIGGGIYKSFTKEIKLYHKDSYPILHTFNSIESAGKYIGTSASMIRTRIYRKTRSYMENGWAILHDELQDRSATPTISDVKKKALIGLKKTKPSHFKGKTNRWTPEQKKKIGDFHKGKVISNEQKQKIRITSRLTHKACKQITLIHIDNKDKKYSFHSISEASRQLNIPLSRLKSKATRPLKRYGKDGWAIANLGSE